MNNRWFTYCVAILAIAGLLCSTAFAAEDEVTGDPASQNDQLAGAPEKKEEKKDEGQEVVVKGVQRLKVKVEKPEPDLTFDVDEIAVPLIKIEDSVLDVSPTAMSNPPVSNPAILDSPQAKAPYVQIFRRPPILTLHPKYSNTIKIAKWRLRITDGFGNVFKDFSGESNLPKDIIWDGKGKNDVMLDVGTSYSYIFSIIDVASNPTSQMGKPIILESLMYEQDNMIVAKLVADVLFEKKERKTEISDKGKLYLREVADLLISRQNYPLIIGTFFDDVDEANYRGEIIQDYLADLLTLPKNNFKIVAQKSRTKKVEMKIK